LKFQVALLLPVALLAQTAGKPLAPAQFTQHIARGVQLMDSAAVYIPDLVRAGAPLVEAARQAERNYYSPDIRQDDSRVLLGYLTALRAFLVLSDALPRPAGLPPEAYKQLIELRDNYALAESSFRALLDAKEETARGSDWDNYKRYAEANTRVGPAIPGSRRVVFLGDSITDGWRLNEYFPDQDFINRGIGGQITGQMLGRMKQDVLDLKPAAVLILAGTNDVARGVPITAIQHHIAMMADLADTRKVKPILASILPVSDYHKNTNPRYEMTHVRPLSAIKEMNEWLRSFCHSRGYVYADYFTALADGNGFLKADYADDGLHPNSAGYRLMAPIALDAIHKTLPATPQPQRRRK
jgi:lysophospholipase L1-like esterase